MSQSRSRRGAKRAASPMDVDMDEPPDIKKVKMEVDSPERLAKTQSKGRGKGQRETAVRRTRIKKELQVKKEPMEVEEGPSSSGKLAEDDDDDDCVVIEMEWLMESVLADSQDIPVGVARNLKNLFEEDNTIPFIARYRKEMTGNMEPEKIREIKETFDSLKQVQKKASTVLNVVNKQGKLTPDFRKSILCAKSVTEVDHLYAPYKPSAKGTLAERARKLGLEPAATAVLNHSWEINMNSLVDANMEGKSNVEDVKTSIQHIIAEVISKDKDVLEYTHSLMSHHEIKMESTKSKIAKQEDAKDSSDKQFHKFELYYNFSGSIRRLQPHQVLAINRGESLKALNVKVVLSERTSLSFTTFCHQKWCMGPNVLESGNEIISAAIHDAYKRLILPFMVRQIRSQLTHTAQKASVDVFGSNLKKLLLTPPIRGKVVLGIDPGFKHGCKLAIVSGSGEVLDTDVINPHCGKGSSANSHKNLLRDLMQKHGCETIALGNGTACRQTELYLTQLIQEGFFSPLDVSYTIVSEQAASIYSCSEEAKQEFPGWDANVVSAVSIARRLQDPLLEYVKIEPKHLGVGMYQHDMPEKMLKSSLDEVVSESVSFVGVDINVASEYMLRRVAGLNTSRAKSIIDWRSKNGPFINREQLSQVKGIGPKTMQQCAGFVRILPETSSSSSSASVTNDKKKLAAKLQPLDRTCIHPESYEHAKRFISEFKGNADEIGTQPFITSVHRFMKTTSVAKLAEKYGIGEPTIQLIVDGLQQSLDYDIRAAFDKPLFHKEVMRMEDLQPGVVLTGKVTNVTHFGAFVDIGVGRAGLVHSSKMRGHRLQLGNRVKVEVVSVDISRGRIALMLREVESE